MKTIKFSINICLRANIPILVFLGTTPAISKVNSELAYANIIIEAKGLNISSYAQLFLGESALCKNGFENEAVMNEDNMIEAKATIGRGKEYSINFSSSRIKEPRYASVDCYISRDMGFHQEFLVERGDSIKIFYRNGSFNFSGKNAMKYLCLQRLNKIWVALPSRVMQSNVSYFRKVDSSAISSLKVLEDYKEEISEQAYWLIKSNIILRYQLKKNGELYHLNDADISLLSQYSNPIWNDEVRKTLATTLAARKSAKYCDFIVSQYEFDSYYLKRRKFNFKSCYQYLKTSLSGSCMEVAILKIIKRHHLDSEDGENIISCIDDANKMGYITSDSIRNIILDYCKTLIPGRKTYDFILEDIQGKTVRLSDFCGKIILIDFYTHPCGACRRNYPIIDSISKKFSPDDLVIICIFVPGGSQNKKVWNALVNDEIYSSQSDINLIDLSLVTGSEDASAKYKITGYPTLILVDKKGNLLGSPTIPFMDKGANLMEMIQKNL